MNGGLRALDGVRGRLRVQIVPDRVRLDLRVPTRVPTVTKPWQPDLGRAQALENQAAGLDLGVKEAGIEPAPREPRNQASRLLTLRDGPLAPANVLAAGEA
jgi:hypothetical protein